MELNRMTKALEYIADSVESGYSALFTYGVKEVLNNEERRELANFLRNLTISQLPRQTFKTKETPNLRM